MNATYIITGCAVIDDLLKVMGHTDDSDRQEKAHNKQTQDEVRSLNSSGL